MRLCAAALILLAPLAAAFAEDAAPAAPAATPAAPAAGQETKAAKPAHKKAGKAAAGSFKTEDEKTVYMLGYVFGSKTQQLKLSPGEMKAVELGFKDGVSAKKPSLAEPEKYAGKINDLAMDRTKAEREAAMKEREAEMAKSKEDAQKRKDDEKAFLDKAAKEKGAKQYPSGLIVTIEKEGKGPMPKAEDVVKVNYEGKLIDGTVFDSSYKRGEPATFPLNGVIKCWTEGVQKMRVGGKAKLICPSDIAYGDFGQPPTIPGGATLVFEVELLDIVKK